MSSKYHCDVQAALTNTALPKVEIVAGETGDEDPEFEVDDEESSHLDTSNVPTIITLTKVRFKLYRNVFPVDYLRFQTRRVLELFGSKSSETWRLPFDWNIFLQCEGGEALFCGRNCRGGVTNEVSSFSGS